MEDHVTPPQVGRQDRVIAGTTALVKGVVGAVPLAGSLLAEVVDLPYKQPIDRRREQWMENVAEALKRVQEKQAELTPDRLSQNEEFVTVLHKASELAALPTAPDVDKQLYFLRLIEELTVNQVPCATLYKDPKAWFAARGHKPKEYYSASRFDALIQAYPEITNHPQVRELILDDLERRRLLGGVSGAVSGPAVYDGITTPLGVEFLNYIAE